MQSLVNSFNSRVRRYSLRVYLLALGVLGSLAMSTMGQLANEILIVSPDIGDPGVSGLTITFTLDTDAPPAPPTNVLPDSVTIGGLSGSNIEHVTQYTVTADFDIPAGETPGSKTAVVTFSIPGNTLTFSRASGFTVTGDGGTPSNTLSTAGLTYVVVDTGQQACYDNSVTISAPGPGQAFAGQDAQYSGHAPNYTLSADGLTVYDENTELTWTQTPDTDGDGDIDAFDKITFAQAPAYAAALNATNYGGFSDWRVPSIKELYSLMDFRGTDPMSDDTSLLTPFIDTDYFAFGYGDTNAGERTIDAQFVTDTLYVTNVMNGQAAMFGLNLADGRIKGYPVTKTVYVLLTRGNAEYGINSFTNNGDGTVTDHATGLMWQQADNATGVLWEAAMAYAEGLELAGYRDWRLPNAKELQSILDYTRSPDTSATAAIDPVFSSTQITNEYPALDYPWYWSSTTHLRQDGSGYSAVYVCFGRGTGYMFGQWLDVHGAGCQRSDRKDGDFSGYTYVYDGYYFGIAPQGDAARMYNHVRCVRGAAISPTADTDGDGLTDWYEWNYTYSTNGMEATDDDDGDGASNEEEEKAGTVPTDPDSVLSVTQFAVDGTGMNLSWCSELGVTYRLLCSTNLLADTFGAVVDSGILATPPVNTYTNLPLGTGAYYRVEVE